MNARRDWQRFWFDPVGGTSLGLFRFLFGLNCLAVAIMLYPWRVFWFTDAGPIGAADERYIDSFTTPGPRPLNFIGPHISPAGITLFFLLFIFFSFTLTIGLGSRLSSIMVWIGLNCLHNRNNELMNGSDIAMSVMAFYLILSPSGAAFSVDRILRILRGKETILGYKIVPWTQRLLQLQVSAIYFYSVLEKVNGSMWQNGTAVYYPLNYPELRRFPIPHIGAGDALLINLMSYFAIGAEFGMAFLVWNPRLRLYALTAGVLLHLGIEYAINVPMFAEVMIASYAVFLTDDDWKNLTAWFRRRLDSKSLSVATSGAYNPRALALLKAIEPAHLLTFSDHVPEVAGDALWAEDKRGRKHLGPKAVREMASRVPLLWPARLVSWFPGGNRWAERFAKWMTAAAKRPEPVAPEPEPSLS